MVSKYQPKIAYIMKGFPRLSETFISNEILLLEQQGMKLHVFAIKSLSEGKIHSVVNQIRTPVTYLPEDDSTADVDIWKWIKIHLPKFFGDHCFIFFKRPFAYLTALLQMFCFSLKYRDGFFTKLKRVYFKDFIRAGYIASFILRCPGFSHLHAHFCHGSTTMTMFVSRLTGIPFSFTAHAKDIYLPKLNPGNLLSLKIKRAQFVATCTDANRVHLQKICPTATHIQTIYHGLNISLFKANGSLTQPKNPPIILAVGRSVAKKGFPYLVQACQILKDKGYEFQCQIIGEEGEQTPLIKQLIRVSALEDVVILKSWVSQEELRQIYSDAACFVLPCQIVENGDRDGIPNVLVEAMAMEIPVISTAISGIPELIENEVDGLLVSEKNVGALAEAIEKIITNPELKSKLAKNGREKVCRLFDSKVTTMALKALFESCIGKNGRIAA